MIKKTAYIFPVLLSLLFAACNSGEEILQSVDQQVGITFSMDNYTKVVTSTKSVSPSETRAAEAAGSEEENSIHDLNLFLFDMNGLNPKSYYFNTPETTSGTWTHNTDGNSTVKLNLTQAEAGTRQVYIVANCGAALSASSIDGLKGMLRTTDTPWSTTLSTPILMSGNKTHNFIANRVLGSGTDEPVRLTRALAKLELNIKLRKEHQGKPIIEEGIPGGPVVPKHQYHYVFLNFEKETYLLKPNAKTSNNLANQVSDPVVLRNVGASLWKKWVKNNSPASGEIVITSYKTDSDGKVTSMTLITYLNERMSATPRSFIGISMPYEGNMPPPEFGPDLTGIYLPQIERNHWYVYDIEI